MDKYNRTKTRRNSGGIATSAMSPDGVQRLVAAGGAFDSGRGGVGAGGRVPARRRGAGAAGARRHAAAAAGPARAAAPHRLGARARARLGPAAPVPRR